MPFAFLLLVLTVPLTRGRLSLLSRLRVRGTGLIALALGLQIAMTEVVPDAPHAVLIALHGLSYGVIAFALWMNRRLPGLVLVGVGALLNAGTIALNGGTLPARPEALAAAGYVVEAGEFKNSGPVPDPVLPWLGDVMATPAFLPFRNVISIGDLVVLAGAALLLHTTCRTRLWRLAQRPVAVPLPSPRRPEEPPAPPVVPALPDTAEA